MEGSETVERTRTTEIVVVTSESCHFCHRAIDDLEVLSGEFPLNVRTVDIRTSEGAEILREHRAPMPPVVLVEGEFFSFGRMSVRKLRKRLAGARA